MRRRTWILAMALAFATLSFSLSPQVTMAGDIEWPVAGHNR